jgi:hypothetical protein
MRRIKLQCVIEQIANWILILSGVFAGLISIADLIFDLEGTSLFKAFPSITLLLLALVATGLGLEKLVAYRKLERVIERSAGGIRLDTWDEVYAAAFELVRSAKTLVRATAFGRGKWAGPDEYLELIAKTAKSRHESRANFLYKVVFGYEEEPDPDRARHILHRREIFRRHQVSHMLRMKHTFSSWGLDLLIVDDKHLIIAFPQVQAQSLGTGIKFVDQPAFVQPIAEWYDERVWERSSDIDLVALQRMADNKA